jgi:hypothetical protein
MKFFQSNTVKAAIGFGSLVCVGAAQAAIDVTAVTASLSDAAVTVGLIGAAVLGVVVVVKVFKYVRGAM